MTTPYSDFLKELQEAVGSSPEPYSILIARATIVIARLQKWQDAAVKASAMAQDYALKNKEQGELLSVLNSKWVEAQHKVDELQAKLSEKDAEISWMDTVVKSWQRANSPGGWVDELRGEIAAMNGQEPDCWYDGNKFYSSEEAASMCMADMSQLKPLYAAAGAAPAPSITKDAIRAAG